MRRREQLLDGRHFETGEGDHLEREPHVDPADVVFDVDARDPAQSAAPQPPRTPQADGTRIGDGDPGRAIAVARARGQTQRLPGRAPRFDEDDRSGLTGGIRVLEAVDDARPDEFTGCEFGGAPRAAPVVMLAYDRQRRTSSQVRPGPGAFHRRRGHLLMSCGL